ncbi:hypothetical protein E4U60_006159 [Claviceps pazoutovae]|uniref:VLRF1 domain-containing protein n=1 Tax=Claviceps pazoutovae TaxID=1649127 RepID=A0A9P7M702_9HYPO|nr:hypothetical protein E4U60_006159 [Claviceps pazoutovae]
MALRPKSVEHRCSLLEPGAIALTHYTSHEYGTRGTETTTTEMVANLDPRGLFKRLVYDLPSDVLDSLTPKAASDDAAGLDDEEDLSRKSTETSPDASSTESHVGGPQSCSLCGLSFTSLQDQRSHRKSDLHLYNLKQKLRKQPPVSEQEFEKLMGNLDESLSGSDSDDSEEDDAGEDGKPESTLTVLLKKQARLAGKKSEYMDTEMDASSGTSPRRKRRGNPPLIWFSSPMLPENHYFGLYRAILTEEEQSSSDMVDVLRKKQVAPISVPRPSKDGTLPPIAYEGPHIFLCMIGGGHFAAMVVSLAPRAAKTASSMNREATVLAHKTFHRYTTRRKQGGSQSANDNAKGAAHSAGSTLRRYNEQALVDDVRALLRDWKPLLDTSELLFVRATGQTNRRTLFGPYEDQVLTPNDTRLRGFPFNTRRATQNELMRSFIELTRLKAREMLPVEEAKEDAHPVPKPSSDPKPAKPKRSEEEETALLHTSQLQAFIRRSKLPALLSYLSKNQLTAEFVFQPLEQNHHAPRPLHLAASQNSAPLVLGLLSRAGADPCVVNEDGKTPFELAGDRCTRDAFRVARSELGEEKWTWELAKVPAGMTKVEAEKREERERSANDKKEAERRKTEEERVRSEVIVPVADKKPKGSVVGGLIAKTAQEVREEEWRGLTPEMRVKLERERRARAAEERLRKMRAGE